MSQSAESPRIKSQLETDREMLIWLRDRLSHFAEGSGNHCYVDSIISRFAELSENEVMFKRYIETVLDAQKLAMAQMQFAQSALKQVERQLTASLVSFPRAVLPG